MGRMGKLGLTIVFAVAACGEGANKRDAATGDGVSGDGPAYGGPMLSCTGLPATCGPAGASPCCANSLVTGGTYYRSYDIGADGYYKDMRWPATVSDFRLDTYEVTVGRFRQFVNAGMGTQARLPPDGAGARRLNGMAGQGGWDSTWNTSLTTNTAALVAAVKCDAKYQSWTDTPGANEALPMNCVTWYEAFLFCAWDGGFLPTEAEWNLAAAGGNEQRAYPWSNPASSLTISCSHANVTFSTTHCVNPPIGAVNRVGSESPLGDGKYGQSDLAGNVREWTLDLYQSTYANPCNDCAVLTAGSSRGQRGGGFYDCVDSCYRGADRTYGDAASRVFISGVRCARKP